MTKKAPEVHKWVSTLLGVAAAVATAAIWFTGFASTTELGVVEQRLERRIDKVEEAQSALPELITALRIEVAKLQSKAPGPPTTRPPARPNKPQPAAEPEKTRTKTRGLNKQIEELIEELRRLRKQQPERPRNTARWGIMWTANTF